MTKHVMAFTYKPKIRYVLNGLCTQTIRPKGKRPKKVGDSALLHGWKCKKCNNEYIFVEQPKTKFKLFCPKCYTYHSYRNSKWSWRLNVEIIKVIDTKMNQNGLLIFDMDDFLDYLRLLNKYMHLSGQDFLIWNSMPINKLAEYDFIYPPIGIAMGYIFNKMYNLSESKEFQIINWKILEEK